MITPDFSMTTLEAAMANTLAAVTLQVGQFNEQIKAGYLTKFNNWLISFTAGRDFLSAAPKPPNAMVVGFFQDPTNSAARWAYPTEGAEPVCAMPPLPGVVTHDKGVGRIGIEIPTGGGEWFTVGDGDTTPVNKVIAGTSADGKEGLFKKCGSAVGPGWFQKVAMVLLCLGLAASLSHAQVSLRFTPEPMAVPVAQIAGARDLGRWLIEGCNDGAGPVTLPVERLSMAAGEIRFVDADDAVLVLTARAKRGFWGQVAHWGPIIGQGVAAGLGVSGITTSAATVAISGGAQLIPALTRIAQGEVPSVVPLVSTLKYPISLPPGGCFSDHRFAAKMARPGVVVARIP